MRPRDIKRPNFELLDDPELIDLCLSGEARAWQCLVERYQRLVFSVALRTGLDRDDADDVFQIVFTTLHRRLGGLRDQTRLVPWLVTTTQRESWRLQRSSWKFEELDTETVDETTNHPDLLEQAERDQTVRVALSRLDERCRALLTALFLSAESPSYTKIAETHGIAVGSIGPTRARCFKKLETLLVEAGLE